MRNTALLICAATLALAGCGRSDHEEEAPIANEAAEAPPPPVEPMPANLATPPAEVANATPPMNSRRVIGLLLTCGKDSGPWLLTFASSGWFPLRHTPA